MKLSKAIEKGCKGKVQITGRLTDEAGGVCALGAACLGVNLIPNNNDWSNLFEVFPELRTRIDGEILVDMIWEKNDDGAGFQEIIDWLKERGY